MRRWLMGTTVTLLALAGCRDAFRARPEIAAEAGGQELKTERLAALMAGIKGVPMSREAAEFISGMWVDQTLFAQAIASGKDVGDSAIAAQVLWPELAELIGSRWHDTLLSHRAPLTPSIADSVYNRGDIRILQHILIRIEPNAEPPARAAGKKRAEAALAQVTKGGDFAKLAKLLSDDPGSKEDGGYLPPAPRGKWVTAFDSAGWTLAPGERTGLVESPFGYHIIRRPPAAEVQKRLLDYARERVGVQLDSAYLDSLGVSRKLKVDRNAPTVMRDAIGDRDRATHSKAVLATYDRGQLTVADFMKWVNALGPGWAADLVGRPDSNLTRFVHLLAQNQMLLQQADSAGIRPTPDEWKGLMERYKAQVDTIRMSLGLSAADFSDPAMPEADRVRAASVKIESHWDEVAKGGPRPRPIPPQLAAILRSGSAYRVDQAGLDRAVELAKAKKAQDDSTNARGTAAPGGPAPGITPGAQQPAPPPLTPSGQQPAPPRRN
jgi:PPIC-type peptidyl-prolyl cis-trans isomerase-like protein